MLIGFSIVNQRWFPHDYGTPLTLAQRWIGDLMRRHLMRRAGGVCLRHTAAHATRGGRMP